MLPHRVPAVYYRPFDGHRAMVAAKVANMRPGAWTDLQPRMDSSEVSVPEAAKLLNVGTMSVKAARVVLEQGSPELARAVEQGKVAVSS